MSSSTTLDEQQLESLLSTFPHIGAIASQDPAHFKQMLDTLNQAGLVTPVKAVVYDGTNTPAAPQANAADLDGSTLNGDACDGGRKAGKTSGMTAEWKRNASSGWMRHVDDGSHKPFGRVYRENNTVRVPAWLLKKLGLHIDMSWEYYEIIVT